NPPQQAPHIDNPIIHHGIEMYFHLKHAAQAVYKGIAESAVRSFPGLRPSPSFLIRPSGMVPNNGVKCHMYLNTCIAFTGPFSNLEQCPFCELHQYDQLKLEATGKLIPIHEFHTIPLGPQLQALYGKILRVWDRERTAAIFWHLQQHNGKLGAIDDFICGHNYLDAVMQGHINENDMALMISMDGAQLYRNKISDCWIYIWVVLDHHPSHR
ncbi:hypothetical protein EDD22DRAFT_775674, partial [Suillus occidentalis]